MNKLAGTNWGANFDALRQTTISVVNSVADFGSPIWQNSTHVKHLDVKINEAMRFVSGTFHATPTEWLPVLSNIVPACLR